VNAVVDASVAMKWYVTENDSAKAVDLLTAPIQRHAPDLLHIETANILWKKVRRQEIGVQAALSTIAAIQVAPMTIHPSAAYVDLALQLACRTDRTAYDCLYVVLAIALNCPFVTADDKLVNAIKAVTPKIAITHLRDWTP
jgi:predicted nucleic acid-binding protein